VWGCMKFVYVSLVQTGTHWDELRIMAKSFDVFSIFLHPS